MYYFMAYQQASCDCEGIQKCKLNCMFTDLRTQWFDTERRKKQNYASQMICENLCNSRFDLGTNELFVVHF